MGMKDTKMKKIAKIKAGSLGKRRDKSAGIAEKVINLLKIINFIEQGKCPTIKRLAEELEVSDRSIYRYLKIIDYIVPIVYDRQRGGYRFERPETMKVIPFKDKEIALLSALADVSSQIGEPMKETFREILSKVNYGTKRSALEGQAINIRLPKTATGGLEYFETLTEAITNKKQIHITYKSKNTKDRTRRVVNPYRLIFSEGLWFLYGYCNLRKDTRWFALDSIETMKVLEKTFKSPDERELEEKLRLSWGIRGGEETEITVRFSKEVTELINR